MGVCARFTTIVMRVDESCKTTTDLDLVVAGSAK